jgi:hypothetical protein
MNETKVIVEVRRGMVECVYSNAPCVRVFVIDHDGQEQGYGYTNVETLEVRPLSKLAARRSKRRRA